MGQHKNSAYNLVKKEKSVAKFFLQQSLLIEAKATSTSGNWTTVLCCHSREGTPCFDVINIRTSDLQIDRHHWWMGDEKDKETYDQLKDKAQTKARTFFEELKFKLQEKPKDEEANEDKGLEVQHPDGTTERYNIN